MKTKRPHDYKTKRENRNVIKKGNDILVYTKINLNI